MGRVLLWFAANRMESSHRKKRIEGNTYLTKSQYNIYYMEHEK